LKVLVIGGTRFIGPFVISQLTSQGHEVAVFNRNQSDTELKNVLQITGDRNQIEDYLEEFQKFGPNVVLDMIPFSEVEAKRTLIVKPKVEKLIGSKLSNENVLVTDAWRAYKTYAKEKGLEHYRIKSDGGKHVIKGLYHIQNVNGLHSRLNNG
jgi:6-phosphogluconate dehydrogenase (decarboxylating)